MAFRAQGTLLPDSAPAPPFGRPSVRLLGVDNFPKVVRDLLGLLLEHATVTIPGHPRPAKLARELRREIGNLHRVSVRGASVVVERGEIE